MALPSSGPISISDINVELGYPSDRQTSLNEEYVRRLLGVWPTGAVSLQLGLGKQVAGSLTLSTPGMYTFNVPLYNTMSVSVQGAGGGGGGASGVNVAANEAQTKTYPSGSDGTSGTASRFEASTTLIANGGAGGGGASGSSGRDPAGVDGTATGGDVNTTGGGGAGGAGGTGSYRDGGNGGSGGKATQSYIREAVGSPVIGGTITVVVGTRGSGGSGGRGNTYVGPDGADGEDGSVIITWS